MTEQLYSKTKIYKLVCNDTTVKDLYVGHTTNWIKRKWRHKYECKNYNKKKDIFIRNNGGWDNWSMILIEEYPCNNKLQAEQRERYWIEDLKPNLNTETLEYISKITDEEYNKKKIIKILKKELKDSSLKISSIY
jgi:hypothetical protein